MRYPRAKRLAQGRGQLRDTLHLGQRPPEAADRAVPGHWEGDLVFGRRSATPQPWQRGSDENTVSVLRGPAGMLSQAGAGNDG
jgi:IS30 family transposase